MAVERGDTETGEAEPTTGAGAVDDVPAADAGLLELTQLRLENRRLRRAVAAMSRSQAALLRAHQALLEGLGDTPVDGVVAGGGVEGP